MVSRWTAVPQYHENDGSIHDAHDLPQHHPKKSRIISCSPLLIMLKMSKIDCLFRIDPSFEDVHQQNIQNNEDSLQGSEI